MKANAVMAGGAQESSWVFILLLCRPLLSRIIAPQQSLIHFVGDNAHFRWSSDDNSTLMSATWGIRKGNIADPPFINVDIRSNKINVNSDLRPDLISRLSFDGDLRKGRAWFVLKNVTLNDTNEYLASISDDVTRVLPYTVVLTVKERETKENKSEITTKEPEEPKEEQAVPSQHPRRVQTSMTEAETKSYESDAPEEPREPGFTDVKLSIIIVLSVFAAILLVTVVIAIFKKRHTCMKGMEKRNKASSEKKLIKSTVNAERLSV